MRDKIKKLFVDFSEEFDLSAFFCITSTYYKDSKDYLAIKALGQYTWELDKYLIEQGFEHSYDIKYSWEEYQRGNISIILMDRYE